MINASTAVASFLAAILLALAGTLLSRAKEIDLSLDAQCFFVAGLQDCLFRFMVPGVVAAGISVAVLLLLLCVRIEFSRRFTVDSMIVSIGFGLMLLGGVFALFFLSGFETQVPLYPRWVPFWSVACAAAGAICTVLLLDRYFAPSYRVAVSLRPLGGVPPRRPTFTCAVLPACILTALAGTLLATHAGSVTPGSSNSFGVLGSTAALMTYGRLSRALAAGILLGTLYVLGILAETTSLQDMLQSYVLPILSLAIVALVALFLGRA